MNEIINENQKPKTPQKKGDRIAKVIARAGVCSRRDAERLIEQGKVKVNGKVLTTPACVVTRHDNIEVEGRILPAPEKTRLFLYHKPTGLVTSHSDEQGRYTVFSQLPKSLPRVVSVGRLDLNSEGLLLLTNDGGLSRHLELPSTGWSRKYRVRVFGEVKQDRLDKLRNGITVDGVRYKSIEAKIESAEGKNAWLSVTLYEGKNREIRRVMEALGLQVNRLIRMSYGPFNLGTLGLSKVEEVPTPALHRQIKSYFQEGGDQASQDANLQSKDEKPYTKSSRKSGNKNRPKMSKSKPSHKKRKSKPRQR